MHIDISKIMKMYGASLDINGSEEVHSLDINGREIKFQKPVSIIGNIINLGEIFLLQCDIHSEINAVCDRCLEDFNYDFNIRIIEKFSENPKNDIDDINIFKGDIIELHNVILNGIILNLPLKYLCSEQCQGLCPNCGHNKNISNCECKAENEDIRLEKLKSLFKIK